MNLTAALAGFFCLISSSVAVTPTQADQFHATQDIIGNTIWLFGRDGVFVYSPDGKQLKARHDSSKICGPREEHTGPSHTYCRFSDIVSDGKKFVWGAINRGKPTIDVFDINTAAMVGSFDTCANAERLEYHPLRDEIWVRCAGSDEDETGQSNLDVFSASNPSGDVQTDILLKDRALAEGLSSRGYAVIDNSLGDIGYLTDRDLPSLFKVDLSQKTIIDKIEMTPPANGLYEAVYSPINKHIYLRAVFCCSCGFEGSDLGESCGRGDGAPVSPVAGVNAGEIDVNGVCGSSCEIPGIDTVGVYEYDTVSESVIATHLMQEDIGGDPYSSPDGKYIILLGRNGGKTIRIIEAGENGLASRVLIDLELGFDMTGYEDKSVSRDFAFIYKDGKTSIVFPSGTEHKIAIVDIPEGFVSSDEIKIEHIIINPDEFVPGRAPHGLYRRIEWAEGTDYVWVNDSTLDYVYVVDIVKKEVVTTLTDLDISSISSVQNYDMARQIEMQKQIVMDMTEKDDKTFEIAAIAIGSVALVAGIANFLYMAKMKKDFQVSLGQTDPSGLVVKRGDDSSEMGLNSVN